MERPVLGDRYELGRAIGSGGFGTVYQARDRRTGADVAVKLVLWGFGSEVLAQRLRREGQVLRRVASRHVAKVYDAGEDESGVWLVTELIEGAPLTVETLGRRLLPHEVLRVARGLLEGLSAVHAAGVIHGDVKPSNVLVPSGQKALDGAKLVDFGLARVVSRSEVAASIGDAMTREGTVIGTARYMAPELLVGGEPTMRSDLYAAGLVLFELLDEGPLFPGGSGRAQLRARVSSEPSFAERVPQPLENVLARMLARDPSARWPNAEAAYDAVADLDTAPVAIVSDESSSSISGVSVLPPRSSSMPAARASSRPPSVRPADSRRASSRPPVARLTSLPLDSVVALRETLRHLDLPMLDALARRARGNAIGRIARAVALALRLELDAAALILEPLTTQSDVASAIGAAMLAPRARRITRARVDLDRDDRWVDTVDAELTAMLVALAASLSMPEDASRDAGRCARAFVRLDALSAKEGLPLVVDATRTTLRVAHTAVRVRLGELHAAVALDLVAPLLLGEGRSEASFHVVVRALSVATFSSGEPLASVALERAERVAAETGTTLLDAAAATAFGALVAHQSPRDERAMLALERAGTLLAHGDSPSLEHEAEQHRASLLIARRRWGDAISHFRAARAAAHSERAVERELMSASYEIFAELAVGDLRAALELVPLLDEPRIAISKERTASLARAAYALASLAASDLDAAEDALIAAETSLREARHDAADIYVLVEILVMLVDVARGALPDLAGPAVSLERFAEEHGFYGFHWVELLAAVIARMPDADMAAKMSDALGRIDLVLGSRSRLARSRLTDVPSSRAAP